MKLSILNNRKVKRHFSNGLWYRYGIMFPWDHRKYLQIGIFGYIIMVQWGSYKCEPYKGKFCEPNPTKPE
jgi:hypothetical protein